MRPAVVMDCGTGFTKMGYGGNKEVNVEPYSCISGMVMFGDL